MDMKINFEEVKIGETKNHLLFRGFVPSLDNFRKYKFDYTGTDLTSTSGLTTKQLERLRKKLQKDYGYPPFDEKEAKDILGGFEQYSIKM